MLIATGYPKTAMTHPIMNSIDGMYIAFFRFITFFKYSFSLLMLSNDFAMKIELC